MNPSSADIVGQLRDAEAKVAELRRQVSMAWDEGYARGVLDETHDLEPADNPYRDEGSWRLW